jgi:hypothetical protein
MCVIAGLYAFSPSAPATDRGSHWRLPQNNVGRIGGLAPVHQQDDLAEKVEAFVSRFGRLQDHLREKLIPRFAALLGESSKSMLDVLAYAEKNALD